MSEDELLEHLRDTLIALVKAKLPDYDVENELGPLTPKAATPVVGRQQRPAATTAPLTAPARPAPTAADRVKALEDQLKRTDLSDEQRQNIQKQLDKEKAAMNQG